MDNKKDVELTPAQNRLMALKFVLFSASAGIIQLAATTILNTLVNLDSLTSIDSFFGSTGTHNYGLAYFIGLVLSVIWNFTINRKFTFKSAANVPIAMLKVLGFYIVFAPLSIWWTVRLTNAGWFWLIVQAGTMIINCVTEFLFWRFVVYKGQIYTSEAGQKELRENGQLKDDSEN